MVRGFGMTLGRKAANYATRPSQKSMSKREMKKMQLLSTFENLILEGENHKRNAQNLFESNKITFDEYMILKSQCDKGIAEAKVEIEKLENTKTKSYTWLYWTIGILFLIYLAS